MNGNANRYSSLLYVLFKLKKMVAVYFQQKKIILLLFQTPGQFYSHILFDLFHFMVTL